MSNFEIQWKALKDRKDEDDPDVPKITKALPIIKWTEAFQDFLHRVTGARMIPLAYNMCSTNSQMNIQGLDSCLRRFNALIQDFKLPWQASKLTMALEQL